jgi:hypothetical protein
MSVYKGKRLGPRESLPGVVVTVDGKPLHPRHDLRNHSPTGFEWGYGGSGPAQLALAILAHHFGVPRRKKEPRIGDEASKAELLHQDFKRAVVARWDGDEWRITTEEIDAVVQRLLLREAQS